MSDSRQRVQDRVRDEMRRASEAVAALRRDLTPSQPEEPGIPQIYGERLGNLLGRRLEEVEGAVTVAMALAERTGTELRDELHQIAETLAAQLETVSELAQAAAAAPKATTQDRYAQEARFEEVHKRIDAVTRELRAGVASLERHRRLLPAPYGERLAQTLGRRLAEVEGQMALTASLAERTGAELRDELADVAAAGEFRRRSLAEELRTLADRLDEVEDGRANDLESLTAGWRAELQALDVRLGDDLAALRDEMQKGTHLDPKTDLALRELIKRIEIVEGDRDAITAQLVRGAETWAGERIALQERVAELAARIVTGPAAPQDGEEAVWPSARAFDQLRINVEGLRMRLAYHEKAVAELSEERDVDDRIDDMQRLLGRLETAGDKVRGDTDTVFEKLERVASRMDERLQQLESADQR
jgi:hypothetical protein